VGHAPADPSGELPVHVTEAGQVFVHVGTRFVETTLEDLDRILERLASDGGTVVYSRDDPAEAPSAAALAVIELVVEHRLPIRLAESRPDELSDSDL
jgi:hypothetical protein